MAFITASTFAQDTEFKFSKEGLTDFVVSSYDIPAKDLYARTLGWVKENSKRNFVVVSSVENEKLTIEGIQENFLCSKAGGTSVCSTATFTISITFKDGKYKMEALGLTEKANNSTATTVHNLDDFSEYYNKDRTLKKYKDEVPAAYEKLFNELNKGLVTYIDKKVKADKW